MLNILRNLILSLQHPSKFPSKTDEISKLLKSCVNSVVFKMIAFYYIFYCVKSAFIFINGVYFPTKVVIVQKNFYVGIYTILTFTYKFSDLQIIGNNSKCCLIQEIK